MTALGLGKAALSAIMGEKPHSSITDWLEILSSNRYQEDDYDGIPELVDSINLQAGGPTEASRAIRKKLKYGDIHRQLRALTILKALVENCGPKFQTSFANDRLTERIKLMATDPLTDERVKRKIMSVLGSWHRQFKDDPKMSLVAGLYASVGGGSKRLSRPPPPPVPASTGPTQFELQQRQAEEQSRLRAERKEAERRQREDEKRKAKEEKAKKHIKPSVADNRIKRKPFNFEQERPLVLNSISLASQASNNLINALKLVNREQESIQTNARVQECLAEAKTARKPVVRYIQLVENEEIIGTLLDTNERIIAALQLYDNMLKSADQDSEDDHDEGTDSLPEKMERQLNIGKESDEAELYKLQQQQRAAVERARQNQASLHPDLQDLSFGELGASSTALPPPIRPNAQVDEDRYDQHGTLSDYSDYDSSDEDTRHNAPSSSSRPLTSSLPAWSYDPRVMDDPHSNEARTGLLVDADDDPFADPTTDAASEVGTPGIVKKELAWGRY